jgi:MFS family permease
MVGYVVNIWYKEKRGTIMGVILCANGIGGALATQILNPIIAQDYRLAYRVVAIILLAVGVLVVTFFRDAPKGAKLPQQQASGKKKPKGDTWSGITFKEALRKPYFYSASVCIFLTGMCLQSVVGVDNQHMIDRGMDKDFAAWAVSISSLALAACKFLVGACNDKKGLKFTMLICDVSAVVMMLMLAFVSNSMLGRGLAVGYSVISALALPLETIMLPLIAADLFGEKEYGKMLGIFVSVNTAGYACGPFLTNLAYDFIGTYTPILLIYTVLMAAITVAFLVSQKQARKVKMEIAEREAVAEA